MVLLHFITTYVKCKYLPYYSKLLLCYHKFLMPFLYFLQNMENNYSVLNDNYNNENEHDVEGQNENENRIENMIHNQIGNESQVIYANEVSYVNEILNDTSLGAIHENASKSTVDAANESTLIEKSIQDAIESSQEILDRLDSVADESDFQQTIVAHSTPLTVPQLRRTERVSKTPNFYYNK